MTTDPRIAALAAALEYIDVRYQGIFSSASGPGPNDLAAAILAELPPDWCGHRPDPIGICQLRCGHHGPHDTDLPPADDEARLRKIEEAAREVCDWEARHNGYGDYVDLDALRAALGSER